MIITIQSGGSKIQSALFIIVDDQEANIIGRNILPQIGVRLIQEKRKQNVLSVREEEESDPEIKQWVNKGSKIIFNNCAYVSENRKIT